MPHRPHCNMLRSSASWHTYTYCEWISNPSVPPQHTNNPLQCDNVDWLDNNTLKEAKILSAELNLLIPPIFTKSIAPFRHHLAFEGIRSLTLVHRMLVLLKYRTEYIMYELNKSFISVQNLLPSPIIKMLTLFSLCSSCHVCSKLLVWLLFCYTNL